MRKKWVKNTLAVVCCIMLSGCSQYSELLRINERQRATIPNANQ